MDKKETNTVAVNQVIISGNLVADPELKFIPSGAAVAEFRIAHTPRRFNKQSNQWEDGKTAFVSVTAWKNLAETVAETLSKGSSVVVVAELTEETWEEKTTGAKRSKHVLVASDVSLGVKRVKQDVQSPSNDW